MKGSYTPKNIVSRWEVFYHKDIKLEIIIILKIFMIMIYYNYIRNRQKLVYL